MVMVGSRLGEQLEQVVALIAEASSCVTPLVQLVALGACSEGWHRKAAS